MNELPARETVGTSGTRIVEPTCEEPGLANYVSYPFALEGFTKQTITGVALAPLGHSWGEATYEWAEDYSSVTAMHICLRDAAHTETETVGTVETRTAEPTCEEPGLAGYVTLPFAHEEFTEQTVTDVELAPLGHSWGEPLYAWNEDHTQVTAMRICEHDETHTESETTTPTREVNYPTENEPGNMCSTN